ncbi:hypothetical protein EDB80DRAFT_415111 [Ilyonectria destructans]|nr:hypothetical protein EDB80DRAFT_415111 [Ilyonectria destructans]
MSGYSHLHTQDGEGASQEMSDLSKSPSTRDAPIGELPAKQLTTRGRRSHIIVHSLAAISAGLFSILVIVYGVKVYDGPSKDLSYEDQCEVDVASPVEKPFIINLRLARNLSFVQAKLVDLLWNVIVGQGGRALHAWILYRYVASDALARIMEVSAVPYRYYMNLTFSTVSFVSLWELCKMIFRRPSWRTVLSALWLLIAIAYVLAFGTYWGVVAGYIAPSSRMYYLDNGTLASLDSPELSMCWVLDGERLGWDGDHIELGPSLHEIYQGLEVKFYYEGFEVWDKIRLGTDKSAVSTSQGFRDVYAYARSIRSIQTYLNYDIAQYVYYDTHLIGEPINETIDMKEDLASWYQRFESRQQEPSDPPQGLPDILKGWEFKDQGKDFEPDLEWKSSERYNYTLDSYNTTFILNRTITSGSGIVPYNSTFMYKNESFELEAPFLDIGKACKSHRLFFTTLGNCVCYRGQPLQETFFLPDNLRCVQREGYVWGLSAVLALVGLFLEAIWAIGCWALWLDAQVNSQLVKFQRSGGEIRASLDLAESVRRDLGANTCAYSDEELSRELDKCEPVGYSIEERDGASHIVLVPARMQSRVKIEKGRLYGESF